MKYKSISIESDFMSKIFGFVNSFKISREPHKDIELEFRNAEKVNDISKGTFINKISSIIKVLSNLVIWNFKNKFDKPNQVSYIKSVDDIQGQYYKRDSRVQKSVFNMNVFISKNYKSVGYRTIFDIYTRLFAIITNKEWADSFGIAYKLNKKGYNPGTLLYIDYTTMVYVLEYLTLTLSEFALKIGDTYTFENANKDYCAKHSTFVSSACLNAIQIITKYESIKAPKKYVLSMVQGEQQKLGTESELFGEYDKSQEFVTETIATIAIVGFSIGGFLACLLAVRYLIYSMTCMKIDLIKSLIQQSDVLLVNISHLKDRLSKLKEGTSEYDKLKKIIESQQKYTDMLIEICNNLAEDDISNSKDIKDQEADDDETLKTTNTNENPTNFDI